MYVARLEQRPDYREPVALQVVVQHARDRGDAVVVLALGLILHAARGRDRHVEDELTIDQATRVVRAGVVVPRLDEGLTEARELAVRQAKHVDLGRACAACERDALWHLLVERDVVAIPDHVENVFVRKQLVVPDACVQRVTRCHPHRVGLARGPACADVGGIKAALAQGNQMVPTS